MEKQTVTSVGTGMHINLCMYVPFMYYTIVKIIFREINEEVGMAKVAETGWWYNYLQTIDDGKK